MSLNLDLTDSDNATPSPLPLVDDFTDDSPLDLQFCAFVTDIDEIVRAGSETLEFYKKDRQKLTRVSKDVKKQLIDNPFAIIDIQQKMNAEKKCHQLVSGFLTDKTYKNDMIPSDIIRLMCNYYPLFYWNNEYISLQSESADIFILPKECCHLSGFLDSFIDNESAASSTVNVEHIDSEILELFVRYIANMHYMKSYARNSDTEANHFVMMIWNEIQKWEEAFAEELDEKTVKQLLDAAEQMDCKSLADLTRNRLCNIEMYKANTHSDTIQNILSAHFQSLEL